MNLLDMINRSDVPFPWAEGDNIPWHDPDFSRRMLKEHLNQDHHAASRGFEKIDRQVNWIHHKVLSGRPTKILDLGCGPGLYANGLAKMGHECVGIDYSPASIAYAADQAIGGNLHCRYVHQDIREAEYGTGFGLAMLIYGEFNIFRPTDARNILEKANVALTSGGFLLLEPHTFAAIQSIGKRGTSWYSAENGLFSDNPYLCLEEAFWDSTTRTATVRYIVIDASGGEVTQHAQTFQAYDSSEYRAILEESGFRDVEFFPSLVGTKNESQNGLMAIVAQKDK